MLRPTRLWKSSTSSNARLKTPFGSPCVGFSRQVRAGWLLPLFRFERVLPCPHETRQQRAQPCDQSKRARGHFTVAATLYDWSPGRTMPPNLEVLWLDRPIEQGICCTSRSYSSRQSPLRLQVDTHVSTPKPLGELPFLEGFLGAVFPLMPRCRHRHRTFRSVRTRWMCEGILNIAPALTNKLSLPLKICVQAICYLSFVIMCSS